MIALLPAEAYRDNLTIDWITQYKSSDEETASLFNDLVRSELAEKAATGGIKGLAALNLRTAGVRQISNDGAGSFASQ